MDGGQPVDPRRAQSHGNDPDAVEVHRSGGSGEGRPRSGGLGPDIPASGPTGGRTHEEEEVLVSRGSTSTSSSGTGARRYGGDSGGNSGGKDLVPARRDSIRWGPIWAGLITALTTFLLLQLLAIGLGLVDIGPSSDGGGGWVPGLIGLIAFFTGGAVAGMTSAIRGPGSGLLNGFMVWALGTRPDPAPLGARPRPALRRPRQRGGAGRTRRPERRGPERAGRGTQRQPPGGRAGPADRGHRRLLRPAALGPGVHAWRPARGQEQRPHRPPDGRPQRLAVSEKFAVRRAGAWTNHAPAEPSGPGGSRSLATGHTRCMSRSAEKEARGTQKRRRAAQERRDGSQGWRRDPQGRQRRWLLPPAGRGRTGGGRRETRGRREAQETGGQLLDPWRRLDRRTQPGSPPPARAPLTRAGW